MWPKSEMDPYSNSNKHLVFGWQCLEEIVKFVILKWRLLCTEFIATHKEFLIDTNFKIFNRCIDLLTILLLHIFFLFFSSYSRSILTSMSTPFTFKSISGIKKLRENWFFLSSCLCNRDRKRESINWVKLKTRDRFRKSTGQKLRDFLRKQNKRNEIN